MDYIIFELIFSDIDAQIVFSNRYYIRELSVDGQYYNLIYQGLLNVVSMDYIIFELIFSDIDAQIVFSNRYYIRELSVDGQYYNLIYQGLLNVVSMDYHLEEEMLYFMDVAAGKIQRMYMNGTGLETIIQHGLPAGEGLSLDWIGR